MPKITVPKGATRKLDNLASVAINAALILGTSDAAALGSTTKMWSDLFLASGAVVNFNNGDVSLTHSANTLTLGGGNLALGANSLTMTGSIADTTNRVTKGWFTDLECTNAIAGSITGTAAVGTAVTVADESSDTSCFPVFVTAATGNLGIKSAAGLTFDSSTDVLSATGFAGPLTGNVTGNVSGSSGSCTGLAATATALATARTIGGTSFDGTANIAIGALTSTNVGATTSAEFAGVISDETGSGALVFANTPTLVTPVIGVATGTSLDLGGTTLLASRALTVDTGGVFNIVLASAAGDDFTVDTDKLVVEGDTGRVGIGTAGPGKKLEVAGEIMVQDLSSHGYVSVYGAAGATAAEISLGRDGARVWHFGMGATDKFGIVESGVAERMTAIPGGNVGIGTTTPGQILDCNDGSGNMIADGYDNHPSFLADKVNPKPMGGVLTKFKQVTPYEYRRIPYVSAEELAAAGIEEFGQERWEVVFPDGYRDGKLKHCPDEEIKAFLDNLADELRTERQEWPKYQRLHYSLALDDLADTFPDILSRNKDGDVTGYSLNNYVGLLHACITGLIGRVEQLETKKGQ